MKKLICLLLCLCLFAGFGGALAAPGRDGGETETREESAEGSREPSGEPSGEAAASEEPEETEEEAETAGETELDLNFNGVRVADMGVDVSTDGQGTYRFSLKNLLSLLGLEMSMDETDGSLVVRDKFGILGALLD